VFASRAWQRIALALNVIGAGILFFSFQATSSDFRLITTKVGDSALCVKGMTLQIVRHNGTWQMGGMNCPDWENAKPAAVVNFEHPSFVTVGMLLLTLGFVIQFMSVPNPKTIAQLRADLKDAKRTQKNMADK
jgi:hypothetical protein